MSDEERAVRAWLRGHRAADRLQSELLAAEGPRPERAVAEARSAVSALARMGLWPGSRDPVSELEVDRVRRRWAQIERNARPAQKS